MPAPNLSSIHCLIVHVLACKYTYTYTIVSEYVVVQHTRVKSLNLILSECFHMNRYVNGYENKLWLIYLYNTSLHYNTPNRIQEMVMKLL